MYSISLLSREQSLTISDRCSWIMFRGNSMRTGVSASRIPRKPSLLWVTEIGPIVSSPAFDGNKIYVATMTGRIFALNPFQKQIRWHVNSGSPLVSSPVVHNGILIAATYDTWIKDTSFMGKNFIFGINTKNGTQIWNHEVTGDVFSSPCLVDGGTKVVVGCRNNFIYMLDVKSGDLVWEFETGSEVWSSPSYNGQHIFVGSDDGLLYSLDLDGKLLWKTRLNGKVRSSSPCLSFYGKEREHCSVLIGTYNGGIYCLNGSSGMIKWSKDIEKPVMASPASIRDKVFFAASDQRIYCFQIEDGSMIWDYKTDDKIWSSPSIAEHDDILFIGSLDSHVYGIDINTGKQTWKFPTMNMIDSSAAIARNMMFIGSRDGLFYIFGSENPPAYIG